MLNQEQILKIAEAHGMSYGVTILPDSPLFNNKQCLADFANEIYAAGKTEGEVVMRERCELACKRMITDESQRLDAIAAVRALKETK